MFPYMRAAMKKFGTFSVTTHAASASFFIILSTFPLTALLVTLLQFLPLTYTDLMELIGLLVPETILPVVDYVLYQIFNTNATAIISVTGVVALWSASRGVYSVLIGLQGILGGSEERSYVYRRGMSILYTFALLIALVFTLVLQVFGEGIVDFLVYNHILNSGFLSVMPLRHLFVVCGLSVIFALVFAVFPARRIHLRHTILGAVLTAVAWVLFSQLFSLYVSLGGGSQFYGSVVLVIMTVMWLYVCMIILFCGGVVCRICVDGALTMENFKKIFQFSADSK